MLVSAVDFATFGLAVVCERDDVFFNAFFVKITEFFVAFLHENELHFVFGVIESFVSHDACVAQNHECVVNGFAVCERKRIAARDRAQEFVGNEFRVYPHV